MLKKIITGLAALFVFAFFFLQFHWKGSNIIHDEDKSRISILLLYAIAGCSIYLFYEYRIKEYGNKRNWYPGKRILIVVGLIGFAVVGLLVWKGNPGDYFFEKIDTTKKATITPSNKKKPSFILYVNGLINTGLKDRITVLTKKLIAKKAALLQRQIPTIPVITIDSTEVVQMRKRVDSITTVAKNVQAQYVKDSITKQRIDNEKCSLIKQWDAQLADIQTTIKKSQLLPATNLAACDADTKKASVISPFSPFKKRKSKKVEKLTTIDWKKLNDAKKSVADANPDPWHRKKKS